MRKAEDLLSSLLAAIHRDGGHHTTDGGLEQSVKDAVASIHWDRVKIDELEYTFRLIQKAEEQAVQLLLAASVLALHGDGDPERDALDGQTPMDQTPVQATARALAVLMDNERMWQRSQITPASAPRPAPKEK